MSAGYLLFIFSGERGGLKPHADQYGDERMRQSAVVTGEKTWHEIVGSPMDDMNGFMGNVPPKTIGLISYCEPKNDI